MEPDVSVLFAIVYYFSETTDIYTIWIKEHERLILRDTTQALF